MATYVRYATKAEKHVLDLGVAREEVLVASECTSLTILDKGAGSFTLHFRFYDGTRLELNQDEVLTGDLYQWDIKELRITNSSQPGQQLKLLTEFQYGL